jgi:8-oxo-dGTP pyrophosphatase MutT (NUDIX family)
VQDYSSPDMPVALAATVIVLRDAPNGPEILMMQRASKLVFHGGSWVFPGGRVDAVDTVPGDAEATARRAAVRECQEEAGLALSPDELVPVSHWTTPVGRPRRFSTWFFAAVVGTEGATPVDVVVDGSEIERHRWLRAEDALSEQASGELDLPPPTFVTLWELRAFGSTAEICASFRANEPIVYLPKPHEVEDGLLSLYQGDVAYDGGPVDVPGQRHRLHMRTSGWRYER